MTQQPPGPPPGNYPPPPPPPPGGGYPPPQPPGGYPPPPPPGGYPPPPPPGGYPPPPPAGGYPPPAPGGYPPPAPGGYPPAGGPAGAGPAFSVGDAFSWSWNKFSKNAVPLIVATLVLGLIIIVLQFVFQFLSAAVSPTEYTSYSDSSGFEYSWTTSSFSAAGLIVTIIGWLVLLVVGAAIQSAYLSGVLDIANGQQVTIGSFFKPRNVGSVIIAGLIVGILTTIGLFLCIIPGLLVSIALMFTIVALLDRNLAPVDAIKTSFDITKANVGNVFLAWLVMLAITIVGAILCGVGLLVAVPVAQLFLVYTYRILTGGQVAPAIP